MFRDSLHTVPRKQPKPAIAFRCAASTLLSFAGFLAPALLAQVAPPSPASEAGLEFPVIMRQNVVAGTTAVGTRVEAKLVVATLVHGIVIPEGATLSGEVTESVAKSKSNPSRLAIRMDSAQWKNAPAPMILSPTSRIYLTSWYYPLESPATADFPEVLPDASRNRRQRRGGVPPFPDPNTPNSPQSRGNTGKETNPAPSSPSSTASNHRVLMKNVAFTRQSDGALTLTSEHSNIKLDRSTIYVLATSNLLPAK